MAESRGYRPPHPRNTRGMMGLWGTPGGRGMYGSGISGRYYESRYVGTYAGKFGSTIGDGSWGNNLIAAIVTKSIMRKESYKLQRDRYGFAKGTVVAFRGLTIGGLRHSNALAKCNEAEKELKKGKITQNVYINRCIRAHKKYASHMYEIGYFVEADYMSYMDDVCKALGVNYEYAPEGRSR